MRYIGLLLIGLEVLRKEGRRKENRRGWDNGNKRKIENNIAITFNCANDNKK